MVAWLIFKIFQECWRPIKAGNTAKLNTSSLTHRVTLAMAKNPLRNTSASGLQIYDKRLSWSELGYDDFCWLRIWPKLRKTGQGRQVFTAVDVALETYKFA